MPRWNARCDGNTHLWSWCPRSRHEGSWGPSWIASQAKLLWKPLSPPPPTTANKEGQLHWPNSLIIQWGGRGKQASVTSRPDYLQIETPSQNKINNKKKNKIESDSDWWQHPMSTISLHVHAHTCGGRRNIHTQTYIQIHTNYAHNWILKSVRVNVVIYAITIIPFFFL